MTGPGALAREAVGRERRWQAFDPSEDARWTQELDHYLREEHGGGEAFNWWPVSLRAVDWRMAFAEIAG